MVLTAMMEWLLLVGLPETKVLPSLLLDRERANDQSHATGLRLTRTRGQKLNESEGTKDLTQPQTQDNKEDASSQF